jgi:prepilin signal peptidase PulO-like enzyme (type II secretory pathway)
MPYDTYRLMKNNCRAYTRHILKRVVVVVVAAVVVVMMVIMMVMISQ